MFLVSTASRDVKIDCRDMFSSVKMMELIQHFENGVFVGSMFVYRGDRG